MHLGVIWIVSLGNLFVFLTRNHFILMTMEVHDALSYNMDRFIREFVHFFHERQLGGHLFLSFCILFFIQHINIMFQHALAFVIERKVVLTRDVCFKPLIVIRFHDLHVGDI